ncbi:MAG: hypothetical protein LDL37_05575 [Asticcacaulis sp.]|jgi:hypothetical protein|uniref:hypothetical protein n=1 Tax=Asticcacaulis sp. TaxID=1872648 RepID=UPI0025BD83F8|nr:hypothetical protein [Asticcacaulis sp.]MCA1934901.1 hypothetical protein [Asticcacaulis sp.]
MSVLLRVAELFFVRQRFRQVRSQALAFLSALGVLVGLMVFALVALALGLSVLLLLAFHGLQALGLTPQGAGGIVAALVIAVGLVLLVAIGRARRAVQGTLEHLISETSAMPGEREVQGVVTRTAGGAVSVWRAFRDGLRSGKSSRRKTAA